MNVTSESAGQIVGRTEVLAVLERALTDTAGGAARVITLAGEPGIGKTRLLVELERMAAQRGHLVLSGRARG
jgi:predicted ATPase